MKLKSMTKCLSWTAAHVAWLTMAFSPVALGKEAENLSQKAVENYVNVMGLDKKTTLAEFWQKSKDLFPKHVQKDLEKYVSENKNLMMPEITVKSAKGTDGKMVPVLEANENGKIQSLQLYGEPNKMAKFNKVVFTEQDVANVYNMMYRYQASDFNIKKESDLYKLNQQKKALGPKAVSKNSTQSEMTQDLARFDGFPRINPVMWKSMTKEQRAGYIVQMRLMWQSAQKILSMQKGSKPSAQNSFEKLQRFVFGEAAWAQLGDRQIERSLKKPETKKAVSKTSSTTKSQTASNVGDKCVVAGYIGEYADGVDTYNGSNRRACSIAKAIEKAANPIAVERANGYCTATGSNAVACNPTIYIKADGNPVCIERQSKEFLTATHFDSKCDSESRLSTNPSVVKFPGKDYSQIMPRKDQIAAIEADQATEQFALTKAFLSGVFASEGKDLQAILNGKWDPANDEMMVNIQEKFKDDIEKSIEICKVTAVKPQDDPQQKLACDQLHRRWLFTERIIAAYRAKECLDPSVYIGKYDDAKDDASIKSMKTAINKKSISKTDTNLCSCGEGKKTVAFGELCEGTLPAQVAVKAALDCGPNAVLKGEGQAQYCECTADPGIVNAPGANFVCAGATKVKDCLKEFPGATGMNEDCTCQSTKQNPLPVSQASNVQNTDRYDGSQPASQNDQYTCEQSNTKWWLLGLLGVGALFFLFKKNKNPAPPQNPQLCAAPKTGTVPNCFCPVAAAASCTAGQGINPDTCLCKPPVTPVPCDDGSTAASADLCPKCPPENTVFRSKPTEALPGGCPAVRSQCEITGTCGGGVPTTR